MLFYNPNFNYNKFHYLMNIKKQEFISLLKTIQLLLKPFEEFGEDFKPQITSIKRKRTYEIDDSHYMEIEIKINKYEFLIQLPLVNNYGKLKIRGNVWIPLFQLIDKPSLIKFRKESNITYRFMNNIDVIVLNYKTFKLNIPSIQHKPDFRAVYFWKYGFEETFEMMGIKLDYDLSGKKVGELKPTDFKVNYINPNDVGDDLRNTIKESFLRIFGQEFLYFQDINKIDAKAILSKDFWYKELKLQGGHYSKNENIIDRIDMFLDIIPLIDKFSAIWMEKSSILEEAMYTLNTQPYDIDFKDMNNKRLRSLEIFLMEFIKYIHGLYLNLKLGKKIYKVNKRKDIRLNNIIQLSSMSQFEDFERFNPMAEIAHHLKITQAVKNTTGMVDKKNRNKEKSKSEKRFFRGDKRNIHESQKGHLCPIVTPDRDQCGVVLTLAAGSQTDVGSLYRDLTSYFEETKEVTKDAKSSINDGDNKDSLEKE